jgi:pentapeptide repeat protein
LDVIWHHGGPTGGDHHEKACCRIHWHFALVLIGCGAVVIGGMGTCATLSKASGSFRRLTGADVSGAKLVDIDACYDQDFTGAIFRDADLTNARLCGTSWDGAVCLEPT